MINLVIMILIAVAASGATLYAGYSFFNTSQSVTDQQLTQARLEETVAAVTSRLWEIDGTLYAPAGIKGATYTYTQVPSWITPNARTTNNVPFLYCPYSSLQQGYGTSDTVVVPGASPYNIQTYASALTGNNAYVVNSPSPPTNAPDGTLAVIVAPPSGSSTVPSCNSLTLDANGHLLLNGAAGTVAVVTAGQFFKDRAVSAKQQLNLYLNPTATGDGSGKDSNNAMTFNNAMGLWYAVKPRVLNLYLLGSSAYSADATTFPNTPLVDDLDDERDRMISFYGSGPATTTINMAADLPSFHAAVQFYALTLNMTTKNWTIDNRDKVYLNNSAVTLGSLFDNGTLYVDSTTAASSITASNDSYIYSKGRMVVANQGLSLTYTANKSLYVSGQYVANANVTITAPSGDTPVQVMKGGLFQQMSASTLTFSSGGNLTAGINVANGGKLYTDVNQIVFNQVPTSYGVNVQGEYNFTAGSMIFPSAGTAAGVQLINGGKLNLTGTIGNSTSGSTQRPATGISDLGGSMIKGNGKVYAAPANSCWNVVASPPNLFAKSNSGSGQYSAPSSTATGVDFLKVDNSSNILCTQN